MATFHRTARQLGWSLPDSAYLFDQQISEFIEMMWQEGEPKALIASLLSGLQFFHRELKGKLLSSWALYSAWNRLELPARAPPMLDLLLTGTLGWFLKNKYYDVFVVCWVMHDAILRTGEACSLTRAPQTVSPHGIPDIETR